MSEKDELDEIFVDRNEPASKKVLVRILKPFVIIDEEGVINFLDAYDGLKEIHKALVYMICKKAMVLRGIESIKEPAGPKEISEGAMISEVNAKHALYRDHKFLVKKEEGGHIIPNYKLSKVEEVLKNGS